MFDYADTAISLDPAITAPDLPKQALAEAFLAAPASERIRLAIADLEAAERAPGYSIDMATWHAPDQSSGTCAVCMAGAVLANRHPIRSDQIYVGPFEAEGPDEFSTTAAWDRIFASLDDLRDGYVDLFLIEDGRIARADIDAFMAPFGPSNAAYPFPGHVHYEDDPAAFKAWARATADRLASFGL